MNGFGEDRSPRLGNVNEIGVDSGLGLRWLAIPTSNSPFQAGQCEWIWYDASGARPVRTKIVHVSGGLGAGGLADRPALTNPVHIEAP